MRLLDAIPGSFGLIHADLIWKNVLYHVSGVGAVDFDDCAFGYLLYDLAPMLLSFKDEQNGGELRQALWEGYTSINTLPDSYSAYTETFVAARHMASIRWIAGNTSNPSVRDRAPEIIAHRVRQLARFVETGVL
jgi:Ser/Thr protein kinase RdoA (MazF antagonist)